FLALTGHPIGWAGVIAYVGYLAAFIVIVAGFGLAASVLFLRYRDLNQVWEVLSQAGFFVAPVIYPLGMLPERLHFLLFFWPPTPVIEFARGALVRGTPASPLGHLALAAAAAAAVLIGAGIFRRLSPRSPEFL